MVPSPDPKHGREEFSSCPNKRLLSDTAAVLSPPPPPPSSFSSFGVLGLEVRAYTLTHSTRLFL
jgi:hypothetical protein